MEENIKDILGERQEEITAQMAQANSEIKYTNIKGKDYAEVKERIVAFRKVYPEGSISTKIVEHDEQKCIIKAEVFNETGCLLATGHASETIGASSINRTSMLENCESSAVGRALGFLGIGIKGAVASALEMARQETISEKRNKLLICRRCGRQINDCTDKSGKVWSAEEVAKQTVKVYGDSYCLPCVAEIKKQKTEMEG